MNVNFFYKIYSAVLTHHILNWTLHMTRLFTDYVSEIFRPHSIICLGGIRSYYLLISQADQICLHSCQPFSILENQKLAFDLKRNSISIYLYSCKPIFIFENQQIENVSTNTINIYIKWTSYLNNINMIFQDQTWLLREKQLL